jgi:hypothetical protein
MDAYPSQERLNERCKSAQSFWDLILSSAVEKYLFSKKKRELGGMLGLA